MIKSIHPLNRPTQDKRPYRNIVSPPTSTFVPTPRGHQPTTRTSRHVKITEHLQVSSRKYLRCWEGAEDTWNHALTTPFHTTRPRGRKSILWPIWIKLRVRKTQPCWPTPSALLSQGLSRERWGKTIFFLPELIWICIKLTPQFIFDKLNTLHRSLFFTILS